MAKKEILLKVACADKIDTSMKDVKECCGNVKDCVEFINTEFSKRYLKSHQQGMIVFNVGYSNEEELNDVNNWFMLEELIDAGIFVKEEK